MKALVSRSHWNSRANGANYIRRELKNEGFLQETDIEMVIQAAVFAVDITIPDKVYKVLQGSLHLLSELLQFKYLNKNNQYLTTFIQTYFLDNYFVFNCGI